MATSVYILVVPTGCGVITSIYLLGRRQASSWTQDCQENYINNLRYTDTILMAESEEELKSLLRRVKEDSEKVG